MREGVLLAEESPNKLLIKYKCNSLEEVFLNLSVWQQKLSDKTESSLEQNVVENKMVNK